MQPINIGILGLGTVGSGTARVLNENSGEITRRIGRRLRVAMASRRNLAAARELLAGTDTEITDDSFAIVNHPDIDIVVELIGGSTLARELVLKAIENGKHIVTANKKLLAEHGNEIFAAAEKNNVMVMFEAAVAGGIPIIKVVREGLAANRIQSIAGIINGTSNFILSQMRDKGAPFAEVLKEAQALGYAEADPTFDIEGHDAGHKITILSSIAFGTPIRFDACYLEGISTLDAQDIRYAEELGYRIKLLGITRKHDNGIELRVHPTLIPEKHLIANVNGVMNAVLVKGDKVGPTLHYGAGAGSLPTASAVVADILDISRLMTADPEHRVPHLAFQPSQVKELPMLPMDEITSSYYLRFSVPDDAGILAGITSTLAKHHISVEALIQKSVSEGQCAQIVILTHDTVEKHLKAAVAEIEAAKLINRPVVILRQEHLE